MEGRRVGLLGTIAVGWQGRRPKEADLKVLLRRNQRKLQTEREEQVVALTGTETGIGTWE